MCRHSVTVTTMGSTHGCFRQSRGANGPAVPSTCHLHDFPEFNSPSPKKKGPPLSFTSLRFFFSFTLRCRAASPPAAPSSAPAPGAANAGSSSAGCIQPWARPTNLTGGRTAGRRPVIRWPNASAWDPLGCVDSMDHGRLDSWLGTVCFGHFLSVRNKKRSDISFTYNNGFLFW